MIKLVSPRGPIVVGIDVGGPTKGLHAVALEGGRYRAEFATRDIGEMVHWGVHTQQATVIAIDAPCAWSRRSLRNSHRRVLCYWPLCLITSVVVSEPT